MLHSLSGSVLGLNAEVKFDASQPIRVSVGSER